MATHVTLFPLPTMTVEEGVRRGLLDITGYCEGVYRDALAKLGKEPPR